MRITGGRLIDISAAATTANQSKVAEAASELSSGLRVEKPSEDPTAWIAAQRARLRKSLSEGTGVAMQFSRDRLAETDRALGTVQDSLSGVRTLAVQGANASYNAESRAAMAIQVRAMFDRIAQVYDLMNSVMTAGLHHRWRARAADLTGLGPGGRALDVACGTGDLAVELSRRVGPSGEVVGSDFSDAMLERARRKSGAVDWQWANALALPHENDHFDAATVGFGRPASATAQRLNAATMSPRSGSGLA